MTSPYRSSPLSWRFLELFLLAGIIFFAMRACAQGQSAPLVVEMTARDENGTILYHRKAYLILGPIEECGIGETYLPFSDGIGIIRLMREEGEKCNPAAPIVRETGNLLTDYCRKKP